MQDINSLSLLSILSVRMLKKKKEKVFLLKYNLRWTTPSHLTQTKKIQKQFVENCKNASHDSTVYRTTFFPKWPY